MPQKQSDYAMIYYYFGENGWSLPDNIFALIWSKMKNEGSLKKVFYGGKCQKPNEMLDYFKQNNKITSVFFDGCEPVAIGWLMDICRNHAYAHFCTFKSVWGKDAIRIGRQCVDWWLSLKGADGPLFDTLIGHTPTENKLALRFIKALGFTEIGAIPKMGFDVYANKKIDITISTKEQDNG